MRKYFLLNLAPFIIYAVAALPMSGCHEVGTKTSQEFAQRATALKEQGEVVAAIIELKNALQVDPQDLDARWQLAQLYLSSGNGAAAEKELVRAEKLGMKKQSLVISLGEALLLQREYERLLKEIWPYNVNSPYEKAQVLTQRGAAMVMLGNFTGGCELYEQSEEMAPSHTSTYRGLAQCALAANDSTKALELIDKALDLDETDAKTWMARGNLQWFNGDLAAAVGDYTKALENNPGALDALFYRAQIHALAKRTSEAKSDVDKLRKLNPRFFGADYVEAMLYYSAGNRDQALDSIQRALSLKQDYPAANLLLAILNYDEGNFEIAASGLHSYLRQAPANEGARKLLAATYLRLDEPDRAMAVIETEIQGEADAQSLRLAGEAKLRSEGAIAAVPLFEQAARITPDDAAILTRLGMTRLVAGDEDQGIADLETASSLSSNDYRADIALAYQHLKSKEYDKALEALAILERKLPNNPGIYNLKGLAYAGNGDVVKARENLEKALALRPTLVSAAVRLAQLDLADNDIEGAKGRYASLLAHDGNSIPAMVGLAEIAKREGDEPAYLDWLTKAAAVSPSALSPRILLARHYAARSDMDNALSVAREAVEGRPRAAAAWLLLGDLQLQTKQAKEARLSFEKLIAIEPRAARAHYGLGKAQVALGNDNSARGAFVKAIDLNPEYVDALSELQKLEVRSGNASEAKRITDRIASLDQTQNISTSPRKSASGQAVSLGPYSQAVAKAQGSMTIVRKHHALLKSGDEQHADEVALTWLAEHPEDRIVRTYLARSYLKREREQEAIKQYEALLILVPNEPSALNNLAVLYQGVGDPRALSMAQKAYSLQSDSASNADTLGWILVQQGKTAEGVKLLEQAAADAPGNPEILLHLAQALAVAGQGTKAREAIRGLEGVQLKPEQERQRQQLIERLQ